MTEREHSMPEKIRSLPKRPSAAAFQSGRSSPANPPRRPQYYLRTIGRALEVLDCFDGQIPLSLKDISARVKLPETSLFRVLLTLEKHKYLQQHRDGTYQLAPKLRLRLARPGRRPCPRPSPVPNSSASPTPSTKPSAFPTSTTTASTSSTASKPSTKSA